MTTELISARHIFGSAHVGDCCACVEHVPFAGDPDIVANSTHMVCDADLLAMTVQGVPHITDRYVAIRSDVLALGQITTAPPHGGPVEVEWSSRYDEEDSSLPFHPAIAGRILASGLTIHAATSSDEGDPGGVVARAGEPIGFVQNAAGGLCLSDVRKVVEVAQGMYEDPTPDVLELENVADVLSAAGVVTAVKRP